MKTFFIQLLYTFAIDTVYELPFASTVVILAIKHTDARSSKIQQNLIKIPFTFTW